MSTPDKVDAALKAAQNVVALGNWLDHEVRSMAAYILSIPSAGNPTMSQFASKGDYLMALYAEAFKAVLPGHPDDEPMEPVLQVMALREFADRLLREHTSASNTFCYPDCRCRECRQAGRCVATDSSVKP